MRRFALLIVALSLSCKDGPPTWPEGAKLTVSVPDCADPDGTYMLTLRYPTAKGTRGRSLDIYQVTTSSKEPLEVVELFNEDERPAERMQGLVLSGDQVIEVVAGDYSLQRTTAPLRLELVAPKRRTPGERPRATPTSIDPLGRCDVFPLPMDLDPSTRQELNAALLAPGVSLRDYELSGEFSEQEHAKSFASMSLALARECADTASGPPIALSLRVQVVEGSLRSKKVVSADTGSPPASVATCLLGVVDAWDFPPVKEFGGVNLEVVISGD